MKSAKSEAIANHLEKKRKSHNEHIEKHPEHEITAASMGTSSTRYLKKQRKRAALYAASHGGAGKKGALSDVNMANEELKNLKH